MKNLDVNQLLLGVLPAFADYLESKLPLLSENWWRENVLGVLSQYQQRRVEQQGIDSLAGLDLSALLRVFDRNWYELSDIENLTFEDRHYVKEMQSIRNRWAHISRAGYSADDEYRDLDTLYRFARLIGCDQAYLQKVDRTKTELMAVELGKRVADVEEPRSFKPGDVVRILSESSLEGAVVAVLTTSPETRYSVFVNGATRTYYESQLALSSSNTKTGRLVSFEEFHTHLTALQIRFPGQSTLYSLNSGRIEYIPYQFRPVLRFIRSERPRLLIADGVGVGKTIEAGLILQELQARRDIRSVLVICPRPLVTEKKWVRELKRFGKRFTQLDGPRLDYCIDESDLEGEWPSEHRQTIIPYSLLDEELLVGSTVPNKKRRIGLLELDPPPRFDLVIVDEAHHIRNPETFRYNAVRFFCDNAEAVVFLTATPLQMGSRDLYVLLNALRPDLVIDEESYAHMAEPNPHINSAIAAVRGKSGQWIKIAHEALRRAAETSWGRAILRANPRFRNVQERLRTGDAISDEERIGIINDLEAMHSFAGFVNRTRRRDIGEFSVRKPETVSVPFTEEQTVLHDEVLAIQEEIARRLHGDTAVGFILTTIRRQVASSVFGLVPLLQDILTRHIDEWLAVEMDNDDVDLRPHLNDSLLMRVRELLARVRAIDPYDPKCETVKAIIQEKMTQENHRTMVFSSFRHTLSYLENALLTDGFRVGVIHGGVPDEARVELRRRFAASKSDLDAIDVLLFSEVGSEGLDYQFCDCIVNYDLPWNPMKIEQRIGRIDRKGQKSETIAVYNVVTPGTIDADIYERCLLRIGVFNSAMGASEDILGEVTRQIRSVAENLTLTAAERAEKLQQIADNEIRLVQEQEELEKRQAELFGIQLPRDAMHREVEDATSRWLSPDSIRRMITRYIAKRCGNTGDVLLGDKPKKTLRLSSECRMALLHDHTDIGRPRTESSREWEAWLKGGSPHLSVAFDPVGAEDDPNVVLLSPMHPLVRQAAHSQDADDTPVCRFETTTDIVPPGDYRFAIYQWRFHGIRENVSLRIVSERPELEASLPELLWQARDCTERSADSGPTDAIDLSAWDPLESQHYRRWSDERSRHRRETVEVAEYRKQSLLSSHRARIGLIREQLGVTTDERIRRMKESQISTAEADFTRRMQEIDIALERTDITVDVVAYGSLVVRG